MVPASKIFTPYRAVGLVSNELPLLVRYISKRQECLIITVTGNSFLTYEPKKLRVVSIGNPHGKKIRCITANAQFVFTSDGPIIYAWKRSTELVHKYECSSPVNFLLPFGQHLVSIDSENVLRLWDITLEDRVLEIEFPPDKFQITALLHPATYLNKVLLGSSEGKLQLWNLNTTKLIYSFVGWESCVNILVQSPAVDVIAIGLADGRVILHNIKYDETVVEFRQEWGGVTSISFRTDSVPFMVSGSKQGHIAIWNLEERKLYSCVRNAHKGPVNGLECFPSEPIMVTSSHDNSLKMWVFDLPDGGARLLKFREGHSTPPLTARFHGAIGEEIVTGGSDSTLRIMSTKFDILNRSLGTSVYKKSNNSKASKRLKMPPITALSTEVTQEQSWDNIAAIHRGIPVVTTWSLTRNTIGDHKFCHERFKKRQAKYTERATCLDVSVCGNFIFIGYDSGHIDKYNLQSGIYRGTCVDGKKAHSESVQGLTTDGLNRVVISAGSEGMVKWWFIRNCKFVRGLHLKETVSFTHLQKESGLLAIVFANFIIKIIDIDTGKVARVLEGHQRPVTDVAYSPDSRWLISGAQDSTIRTWDIPSGQCIDCFLLDIPVSSLSMSPTGDFLATLHAGYLGVYLWANNACYNIITLNPLPRDFKPTKMEIPSTACDISKTLLSNDTVTDAEQEMDAEYKSPEQISEELITLAILPTSRWLNLLSLDIIKKRNKPIAPPEKPKAAPFFIPTVPGLEFQFCLPDIREENDGSKLKKVTTFQMLTPFGSLLQQKRYQDAIGVLLDSGPTSIDVEIRSLDPAAGGSKEVLLEFLHMIHYALSKRQNFEAIQGYLGLYLKVHSEFVIENHEATQLCQKVQELQECVWKELRDNVNQSLCILSFMKNSALINY